MTTFYTLLIATDTNSTPYAACYIQVPCTWVPTFQATPSTTALGLSGSKQGGVYSKTVSTWRMTFWVFQAPEGRIRALTAKITIPRLR